VEEVEVTILFESKDKVEVERFKKNLLEQISPHIGIRFVELDFDKKEDLSTRGRELAEKFFNAAVGLGAIMTSEGQEHQESSGLAFTPEWFSSSSKASDERTLAECYVYAKTFGLNDFPAVLADKMVIATGRLPSVEEVASQFKITVPLIKEPLTQSISQETENMPVVTQEMDAQGLTQIQPEPLRVHLAQEQAEAVHLDLWKWEAASSCSKRRHGYHSGRANKSTYSGSVKENWLSWTRRVHRLSILIENENRCALLHIAISDVKKPVCRLNLG